MLVPWSKGCKHNVMRNVCRMGECNAFLPSHNPGASDNFCPFYYRENILEVWLTLNVMENVQNGTKYFSAVCQTPSN